MNEYLDDDGGGFDGVVSGSGDFGGDDDGMFLSNQQAATADVAALPKILLMGPRRGGKTSIQVRKVVESPRAMPVKYRI
jgi:hypothetical protein